LACSWSPLAGGLLAGAAAKAANGRRADDSALLGHSAREQRIIDNLAALQQYEALAADLDVTPTALALAWLLSRPSVTAPVLGPRTLHQLTGSLQALDVTIDDQSSACLDELFPGPGGEAPDAYTWA
jgi:aryl-alcohol dehydrogenase-like predicted oxidoreductase